MTNLKQRVAGGLVLTAVSAASLIAGGLLLGAASADEPEKGSPGTASGVFKLAPEGVGVVSATLDSEEGCVIAFVGKPPEGANVETFTKPVAAIAGSKVEKGKIVEANGDVKTWTIVDGELVEGELPEGGLPKDRPFFTKAIEAKPLAPGEIERLKASGELQVITPEDCTIVNPEDLPLKPAAGATIERLKTN